MSLDLAIESFDEDYARNPNPDSDETPFDDFWSVRDQVLSATQKHGPTGPEDDNDDPKFYIVEDQYNDDLYQIMELYDANALTIDWLRDICDVLSRNPGWAVSLSVGHFSLLVFADRLLVPADKFSDLNSLDVVLAAADQLEPSRMTNHAMQPSTQKHLGSVLTCPFAPLMATVMRQT